MEVMWYEQIKFSNPVYQYSPAIQSTIQWLDTTKKLNSSSYTNCMESQVSESW